MMTSSEQGNDYYFKSNFFRSKAILVLNVSAKFEWHWIKDEEAVFEYIKNDTEVKLSQSL